MADLPYKFWINADSGEIVPVSYHHALTVMEDPTKFGFPPGMQGTDWARPAHLAKIGKWTDTDSDSTLYRVMFNRGWVRSDNSSTDTLNLETTFLPDASKSLATLLQTGNWFTDVFLDFDHAEGDPPDEIHLEDSDEIEAFADRTTLPRRYAKIALKNKRIVRRHSDDADDKIAVRPLGGLSLPPIRDLDAVGSKVGEGMERIVQRYRLVEVRLPVPARNHPAAVRHTELQPVERALAVPGARIRWFTIAEFPEFIQQRFNEVIAPFLRDVLGEDPRAIKMTSDMPGTGSSRADVRRMWEFLLQRGRIDDQFSMAAMDIDPRVYRVEDAHVVAYGGYKFFMTKERAGHLGEFLSVYVAPDRHRIGPDDRPQITAEAYKNWQGTPAGAVPAPTGPRPIQISADADKFLKSIPQKHREQITRRIQQTLTGPGLPPNSEKIKDYALATDAGRLPVYRVKSGEYRIVFTVANHQVTILRIGHRQDAYRGIREADEDLDTMDRPGEMWTRGRPESFRITNTKTGESRIIMNLAQFARHNRWDLKRMQQSVQQDQPYGIWKITRA